MEKRNKREKHYYDKSKKYKIDYRMKNLLRKAIIRWRVGRAFNDCFDFTFYQLKLHLEKNFLPGMCWGNYGIWHIDHKIPKKNFNYEGIKDIAVKKCWGLQNLQPLWAKDNIRKGCRTLEEMQGEKFS